MKSYNPKKISHLAIMFLAVVLLNSLAYIWSENYSPHHIHWAGMFNIVITCFAMYKTLELEDPTFQKVQTILWLCGILVSILSFAIFIALSPTEKKTYVDTVGLFTVMLFASMGGNVLGLIMKFIKKDFAQKRSG